VLVVAATPSELDAVHGVATLCCGIGPVEAALTTARALALGRPALVLHVGIAGAHTLAPPALVLGSESVYSDLAGVTSLPLRTRLSPDPELLEVARRVLPTAHVCPIATSARIGGGEGVEVEAMEGFAVLGAARQAGVPALELRAISNTVGEPWSDWRVGEALVALAAAVAALVEAFGA